MNDSLPSLFSLADKHALVTGGGTGIGALITTTLAQAGAKVTLVGRRANVLQKAIDALAQEGTTANSMPFDVTHLDDIADFAKKVETQHGTVDILVNAAGANPRTPIHEVTPAGWREVIDANLSSAFFMAQAFAPGMVKRKWGRILNVASLQCRLAFEDGASYGAAKGGVDQLTRAMAKAWSGKGVNANAIAPGFFLTDMTKPVFLGKGADELAKRTAIGRNGELKDLRGAVLLLTTPASDYITGQTLFIDGGFTAI